MTTKIAHLAEYVIFDGQEDDDDVHWFDEDEYPWAYCGKFIGYDKDVEPEVEVNCPLCIEVDRERDLEFHFG